MSTTTHTYPTHTRWLTLIGTILTQLALGSVYTWSLFNHSLANKLDQPINKVALSFGILSLSLAIASSLAGKLQERFGVRRVAIGAGVMLAIGLWLTSQASNLWMLYLSAGVLVGLADGAGYLMTLSNCVKWFPERKGLISACAIGAYGLGSLCFKFILSSSLISHGMSQTFVIWGVIVMVMIVIGAFLMTEVPQQTAAQTTETSQSQQVDYDLGQAMRFPQYWMLALMFVTACMSGLYIIGIAKDIGENLVHLNALSAATAVTVIAIANLGGRLVLGVLSDKMSRVHVVSIAQIVSLAGMALLMFTTLNEITFFIAVACIAFSFGGTITVFPSLVSDFFGLNNLTRNYGVIYLGFGVGSILGSLVASVFSSFTVTFGLIILMLVVSLVLSLTISLPNQPKVKNTLSNAAS